MLLGKIHKHIESTVPNIGLKVEKYCYQKLFDWNMYDLI